MSFPYVFAFALLALDRGDTFSATAASSTETLRLRGLGAESALERLELRDLEGRGDIVSKVAGDLHPTQSLQVAYSQAELE